MSPQRHRRSTLVWTALVAIAAACSSPAEPVTNDSAPTVNLLVVNGTCTASGCGTLQVLGFPAVNQPLTPGGLWSLDLGVTSARLTCMKIPASAMFRIIGQTSATTSDTITKTWTTVLPLALGTLPPGVTRFQATPTTEAFVPATARGWRVTLPGDAPPVPADACGG